MNDHRDNGEFVTKRKVNRVNRTYAGPSARSTGANKAKRGVSSILSVCAVMLCCLLVLSIAFFDEPYVQTMAGGQGQENQSIGQQILGRLTYLGERFISVFTGERQLESPLDGEVVSAFSEELGYVEFDAGGSADVLCVDDGRVVEVYGDDTGVTVRVSHGDGRLSSYCSLSEALVEEDQPVSRGDVLGITASGKLKLYYEDSNGYANPLPMMDVKTGR